MNLLLLSNSTLPGTPYFDWPKPHVQRFLGEVREVVFVPYAAVTFSYDEYEHMVGDALATIGVKVKSVHHSPDPAAEIAGAQAIFVGGGNTFCLLAEMQERGLVEAIRAKVRGGTPYVGWSAGVNVACPTIKTTNDMPIRQPRSFEALNLVPYQINPHYTEATIPGHGGESRLQRLNEFTAINTLDVVCLPEGCALLVERGETRLIANAPVKVLHPGGEVEVWDLNVSH